MVDRGVWTAQRSDPCGQFVLCCCSRLEILWHTDRMERGVFPLVGGREGSLDSRIELRAVTDLATSPRKRANPLAINKKRCNGYGRKVQNQKEGISRACKVDSDQHYHCDREPPSPVTGRNDCLYECEKECQVEYERKALR